MKGMRKGASSVLEIVNRRQRTSLVPFFFLINHNFIFFFIIAYGLPSVTQKNAELQNPSDLNNAEVFCHLQ